MSTSQSTHRTASHIWLSHGAHMDESHASFLYVTYLIHMGNVPPRDSMRTYPLSEVHPKGMWQFLLQKWVMTHISMSHITHLNIHGQCAVYSGFPQRGITAHIWMRHVTHLNIYGQCTVYWWHLERYPLSEVHPKFCGNVSCRHSTNESRHTFEWVTARIRMSHGTHSNESRHTFEYLWAMCSVLMVSGTLPPFWGPPEGLWQSFWLTRIVVSFVFCGVMGLFWRVIGLFWRVTGVFWRVSQYLGHFSEGPIRNNSIYCNKSINVYKWIHKTPKTEEKKSPYAYFKKISCLLW